MKPKDIGKIIDHILSKDFGMIFLEIILEIIHIWIILSKYYVSMHLKVVLCITFLFILINLFKRVKIAIKVFREKHIPIVVAVARSDDETKGNDEVRAMVNDVLDSMNEYSFDERTFEDDFHVNRDNWLVERKSSFSDDSSEWTNLVHRFKDAIIGLSAMPSLRGRKVFHLFLKCPSALAMGMGAVAGIHHEVVLHQLQRGTGSNHPYPPLIDFHTRSDFSQGGLHEIKSKVDLPYRYTSVEAPETFTNVVLVSLHLARDDPKSKVDELASNRSLSVVHIRNTYNNTLSVDADWFRVAHEVATVLLDLSSHAGVEKIELYQSCPVIIAFAVGMALGMHTGIEVFQWDGREKRYYPVFRLNTLRHGR
jgi:hypothetical protein